MAAEVFQIVTEGINNICKHTRARTAGVVVEEEGGMLAIDIFNPASVPGQAPLPFVPRSIAERVQGLGGKLDVEADGRQTLLRIRIPN
jgi:signal transduction histidine kinase